MRQRGLILMASLLCAGTAHAEADNTDIARLTMGSPLLPGGAWELNLTPVYTITSWSNAAEDTLKPFVTLTHAFSDRFQLALSYEGLDTGRDTGKPSEINIEPRFLLLEEPLKLAVYALIGIPFPTQPLSILGGAEAMKDLGPVTLQAIAELEGYQYGAGVAFRGDLLGGAYYRFGLNGILGASVEERTEEGLFLNTLVGGRVSPNIFLSLEPSVGLTSDTPDFRLLLQLTFYFGPFRTMGLE